MTRSRRDVLRHPAVGMAVGTAGSRATGLLRTVALAGALGVGRLSDAYNTANTAPNMLFALVAGGVLSASLVPMLARHVESADRRERASVMLGTVTMIGVGMALVMALGAPWLMRLLASGAGGRPGEQELLALGTTWMRIFALQIPCYAVSVAAVGVLTAHRRLTLGAAAGIVTNVITIAAAIAFVVAAGTSRPALDAVPRRAVLVLGWGTTVSVAAMAALQLWGARRVVPGLRFAPRLRHPVVSELGRLGRWVFVYVSVNQIGLAAVVAMASSVSGGVSAYQWAFMLMQLPYAVVGVSVFSAAYPALAEAADRQSDLSARVARPAFTATALLLPAAAGLFVLAPPLAALTIGNGSPLVAMALRGFAVSLVPFSMFQLLTRVCYARSDARTPALVNIAANATMLVVDAVVLVLPLSPGSTVMGLALGHAASYFAGCAGLTVLLRRDGVLVGRVATAARRLAAPVAATAIMAVGLALLPMPSTFGRSTALRWSTLGTTAGLVLYIVAFAALRAPGRRAATRTSPDRLS